MKLVRFGTAGKEKPGIIDFEDTSLRPRFPGSGRPARGAVDLAGPREVDHAAGVRDNEFCIHGHRLSRVRIAMTRFGRSARGPER